MTVDIVIPVHNEENCLQKNVLILHSYLEKAADFTWNIIIADNASTDGSSQIAIYLSSKYENIQYIRSSVKGRGYSLRKAFLSSKADIVCYMDVDLSTNLPCLNPLIKGIASGSDICIGSRSLRASRSKRRLTREIVSRIYNLLIKCVFINSFSDAQCGFKALRTDVARHLVPLVKNNNWFFDTELLLLAEHHKYRILEIPVEWIEDIKQRFTYQKLYWSILPAF